VNTLTIEQLNIFSEILRKDPRVVRLDELESEINKDSEVLALSSEFKKTEEAFNYALEHYGENSEITKKKKINLLERKQKLNMHPLVADYNKAFIEVKDLFLNLEDILFSSIKDKSLCKECHD